MSERKRLILLILIMSIASFVVGAVTIYVLYGEAIDETRARLVASAQSQEIDLGEIRAPFIRAAAVALCCSLVVVPLGVVLFLRVSNPMIRQLRESCQMAQQELAERQQAENAPAERKMADDALRESEARMRGVLNTAVDGIITIDESGVVQSFNPAAERIFGYPAEEVVGQNVKKLMLPPDRDEHDDYVRRYMETGRRRIIGIGREVVGRHKNGSIFPVDLAVSEIQLGHRRIFTGIVRDVSERRALEKEVSETSSREQQRIGRDLHDGLGQELTGIAFIAGTLQKKLAARSLPEAQDAAEITELANASIDHTRALVKGLCPVDLKADGLMTSMRELADTMETLHSQSCSFECRRPVLMDNPDTASHLYYIAYEAANNAVKHAKARNIVISLTSEGDQTVLTVEDDGIGLPTNLPNDAGRGLHIMKYRARMIGGSIVVRRGANRGTVVTCAVDHRAYPPGERIRHG